VTRSTLWRVLRTCALGVTLLAAGCGGEDSPDPSPLRIDDAFVTRIVPHQHVAAALADTAATKARGADVRRLARSMRAMRRRTLPALDDRLTRVPAAPPPADLGVAAEQAGDEVTPAALDAARPLDPAFLTVMTHHDQGALALVAAELERGRDPAVKAAAQRLAAELTRELARINRMLSAIARRQASG
jgi:uncharacterized protein (DUF305 family)